MLITANFRYGRAHPFSEEIVENWQASYLHGVVTASFAIKRNMSLDACHLWVDQSDVLAGKQVDIPSLIRDLCDPASGVNTIR